MMQSVHQQLIATIAYADVFDYPLTDEETRRWMISLTTSKIATRIPGIDRIREGSKTYHLLHGRKDILSLRANRHRIAQDKWRFVRSVTRSLQWIPTVELIGVTGGLSVDNAKSEDDIDLFFIAHRGTLWMTRLLVTIASEIMGIRRRPGDHAVADKICLNMFMAEDALGLAPGDRDLFSAHEVLQMVPIWEREGSYRRFLQANEWVKWFLPNAWRDNVKHRESRVRRSSVSVFFLMLLGLCEPLARELQLRYMRRRRTAEVITPGVLRFHPKDARVWIKKKYRARLRRYNIPLDNVFYHR